MVSRTAGNPLPVDFHDLELAPVQMHRVLHHRLIREDEFDPLALSFAGLGIVGWRGSRKAAAQAAYNNERSGLNLPLVCKKKAPRICGGAGRVSSPWEDGLHVV